MRWDIGRFAMRAGLSSTATSSLYRWHRDPPRRPRVVKTDHGEVTVRIEAPHRDNPRTAVTQHITHPDRVMAAETSRGSR